MRRNNNYAAMFGMCFILALWYLATVTLQQMGASPLIAIIVGFVLFSYSVGLAFPPDKH